MALYPNNAGARYNAGILKRNDSSKVPANTGTIQESQTVNYDEGSVIYRMQVSFSVG